jgi:GNAT superfamily N-acetyltransferase
MQAKMRSIQDDTLEGIKSLGVDRILSHIYWMRALALSLEYPETKEVETIESLVSQHPVHPVSSMSRKLRFRPIDLARSLDLCLQFRLDADRAIFGTLTKVTKTKGLGIQSYLAFLKKQVQALPGSCVHLMLGNQAIGQVELSMDRSEERGHIHLIYLVKNYRRKGWGKLLETYALRYLSLHGCQKASLKVHKENRPALHFYEGLNWNKIQNKTQESIHSWDYEKPLGSWG